MLMNSEKLMDGTRVKKKIGKEENLTFYANCFFSQYNALLYVNMTCLPNVIYFLENFLRRN